MVLEDLRHLLAVDFAEFMCREPAVVRDHQGIEHRSEGDLLLGRNSNLCLQTHTLQMQKESMKGYRTCVVLSNAFQNWVHQYQI